MAENPFKYSDFIKPDTSITDLIAQLESVRAEYAKLNAAIQGDAAKTKASITTVSGATDEQRDAIKAAAIEADKLTKAEKALADANKENNTKLLSLNQARKDANTISKLTEKLNSSEAGSYDKLSAQYALNKIRLNAMSSEMRAGTVSGQALEKETLAIYNEMKKLQEATGKTSLNVGNYEAATVSLRAELKKNTAQLAVMALAGQEGSTEYQKLLAVTAEMKDAMNDSAKSIAAMASDTSNLDSVLGLAGAAAGGFSVFTGAMELSGVASDDVAEAQKKLQSVIAITTGLQSVQNAVQKDSALMLGIAKIQSYALSKAEAYRRLIQIQGTSATVGATVAQRVFNAVAAANPYVLLAVALITVVGALVLFSSNSESAAQNQQKLNEVQKAYLDLLEIEKNDLDSVGKKRLESLNTELASAKARNASNDEVYKLETTIADRRQKNNDQSIGFYAQEINDLDKNTEALYQYRLELNKLQTAKAGGSSKVMVDIDLNGKLTNAKIDDAITAVQGKIDNLGRAVDIAVTLNTEGNDIKVKEAELIEQRKQQLIASNKVTLDLTRKAEDNRISLIENSYDQERAKTSASYVRQIADLKYQLATDKNLTVKSRTEINDTVTLLELKLNKDLKDIENKNDADKRATLRNSQDIELNSMTNAGEKKRTELKYEYDRQIEDIKTRLATETGLTTDQQNQLRIDIVNLTNQKNTALNNLETDNYIQMLSMQKENIDQKLQNVQEGSQEEINLRIAAIQNQRLVELAQNKKMTTDVRKSESDINAKYDALVLKDSSDLSNKRILMLFDQQQVLDQSEEDLNKDSEAKKTQYKLAAEKERLKKILDLNDTNSQKLSDAEVQTIKNTIKKIDNEINASKTDERSKDIYGLFGLSLTDEVKEGIDTTVSYVMDALSDIAQSRVDAANTAVEAANTEVDASQDALDKEIEARNNGYASNISGAQKELDEDKKNQAKAQKEKEKATKAQNTLDTITQTSSLITASAKIWSAFAFAPPLAIAALALMWGSFAAAKIQASKATKSSTSYGEGGLEILDGGSHASGNDIPIGMTSDGKDRRAEGGEALAIISKSKTRKYKGILPDLINSLNKGTFEKKYGNAYNNDGMSINVVSQGSDMKNLESDVNYIRKQGEHRYYTDGKGRIVEVYKNLKRTYNAN